MSKGERASASGKVTATSPEMREAILSAMARKALQGNVTAAKIVLDETASEALPIDEINEQILSLAELINHPLPDRTMEDVLGEAEEASTSENYH